MAKVQRTKVVVEASYYNFDKRYELAMAEFEGAHVISVNVISSKDDGDSIREEYIIFYQELQEETEDDFLEAGDLVYYRDVNTGEKQYETVEKVIFEDGLDKCFFVEDSEHEGDFMEVQDVTLVSKKKDRKDI